MKSKVLDLLSGESHKSGIIRLDYSPYALNQARRMETQGINDRAIRRKYVEGISIDGIESLDLDDAIWADETQNGYCLWVHISDVTEGVEKYSPLDLEALKRTTSIYRRENVIHMYPPQLSQDIFSLNEDGEKLCLTMQIDLDKNGNIVNNEAYESAFKNKKRYDYENFQDDYLNPESENHSTLQLMYEIAKRRRSLRKKEGANLMYDESDRRAYIGRKEERSHESQKSIPRIIIEEFMILANIASAMIAVKNSYNTIFRVHSSGDEKAYYSHRYGTHSGLALEHYMHFTSPIRRYADIIVHRVLKLVHLRGEKEPYSMGEIEDITHHINISKAVIDILGKDVDNELRGQELVQKLKKRNGRTLTTSHFTDNIRNIVSGGKKIPKAVVAEIIHDLAMGEKGNWAWAIGVLLVSKDEEVKQALRRALLDDNKFKPKAVFALLNNTKILPSDDTFLFCIVEEEKGNQFSICVYFKGEKLFSSSIQYGKFLHTEAIGITREKVLRKIIEHFIPY